MAHVKLREGPAALESPTLVEGLPGVGLVGKIVADHLVEQREMDFHATVHCEGLPQLGVYHGGEREVVPPVRLYVDEDADLLVLQSDVPVSASAATDFASCITNWLLDNEVLPLFLSGLPTEKDGVPELRGVATGDVGDRLEAIDVDPPGEDGAISGPTGALLNRAAESDLDGIGLVVQSDPNFPDPEAARVVIEKGVAPLADVEVPVQGLVESAEKIKDQKQQLAERMQDADAEESTKAQPLRMFQ